MERKPKLFGHICRIVDIQLVKNAAFGIVEEKTGEEDRAWNG